MNKLEYAALESVEVKTEEIICVEDLKPNLKDRTLLYGYKHSRDFFDATIFFHVYLKNKRIYAVAYEHDYLGDKVKPKNMREIKISTNAEFALCKRVYPETCDYDFCKLLKQKGIHLTFARWNDNREKRSFYGFTLQNR